MFILLGELGMSDQINAETCICCLFIILIIGLAYVWITYGSLPFLVGGGLIGLVILSIWYSRKKDREERQRTEAERTLNVLDARMKEEEFEKKQRTLGLTKYESRNGEVRWGTPEQVAEWARADRASVEVILQKEVVKIRCPYCGKLYDEHLSTCPHCGASR
jgi:hypothetical protein